MNDISDFTNIGLNDTTLVSVDGSTKTNPKQQFAIINAGKTKQRPYDININKINKKAGKITRKSNAKYSDKQNFRIYKSKVAPNLYSKRMVDEEDDIVAKIKEAFGIEDKENTNFTNVETAQDYVKAPPEYQPPEEPDTKYKESEINQVNFRDYEDLTGLNFGLQHEDLRQAQALINYTGLKFGLSHEELMRDWARRQESYSKPFYFPSELARIQGQSSSQLSSKSTKKPLKYTQEEASNLLKFNIKKKLARLGISQAKADLRYALNRHNDPDYITPSGEYVNLGIKPGSKYLEFGHRPAYKPEIQAKLDKQAKDFYAKQNEGWEDIPDKPKKRGRPKGSKTDNSPSAVAKRNLKKNKMRFQRRNGSGSK